MEIVKFLIKTHSIVEGEGYCMQVVRPRVICTDGFSMSVQASDTHYCSPHEAVRNPDECGSYRMLEVGFPSEVVEEFIPYAEDSDQPTRTVYAYVPIKIIESVIQQHGGIDYPVN